MQFYFFLFQAGKPGFGGVLRIEEGGAYQRRIYNSLPTLLYLHQRKSSYFK